MNQIPESTMNGRVKGYFPEYRENGEQWKRILVVRVSNNYPGGIPYPEWHGGLLEFSDLYGEEQANALAWVFAAHRAKGLKKCVEVRVSTREIEYDIKVRIPEKCETLTDPPKT